MNTAALVSAGEGLHHGRSLPVISHRCRRCMRIACEPRSSEQSLESGLQFAVEAIRILQHGLIVRTGPHAVGERVAEVRNGPVGVSVCLRMVSSSQRRFEAGDRGLPITVIDGSVTFRA